MPDTNIDKSSTPAKNAQTGSPVHTADSSKQMKNEERREHAEEELKNINKRTGRNLPVAIATGVGLVALILILLFVSRTAFAFLIAIFVALALYELRYNFATAGISIPLIVPTVCGLACTLGTYFSPHPTTMLGESVLLSLLIVLVAASTNPFVHFTPHQKKRINAFEQASLKSEGKGRTVFVSAMKPAFFGGRLADCAASALAFLYVTLLTGFLVLLLVQNDYQTKMMLALFIPALSDTGGLIFGAAFGKHKLSPRISPKKSYEGLSGSCLFAVIGAVAIFWVGFPAHFMAGNWWQPVVLGIAVTVFGTIGDLSASMIKRDLGLKDMGHILAGHGGVLDRADSIILAAPVCYFLLLAFGV